MTLLRANRRAAGFCSDWTRTDRLFQTVSYITGTAAFLGIFQSCVWRCRDARQNQARKLSLGRPPAPVRSSRVSCPTQQLTCLPITALHVETDGFPQPPPASGRFLLPSPLLRWQLENVISESRTNKSCLFHITSEKDFQWKSPHLMGVWLGDKGQVGLEAAEIWRAALSCGAEEHWGGKAWQTVERPGKGTEGTCFSVFC